MDTALVVTKVTTRGDTAFIEFEDGHRAAFEGYSHGFGYQIEGLRAFYLFRGTELVVQYNSRLHREGPREDEHRFVLVADGYTTESVIGYWEAARRYLHNEYFTKPHEEGRDGDRDLWYPWMVTKEGWVDLMLMKEGHIPLPATDHS
ncbi:MAG: hypothetical protein U0491_03490 [Candidatus Saccharimonadales bacterium]